MPEAPYSRQRVIDMLTRLGHTQLAAGAAQDLPDPVYADQAAAWWIQHGPMMLRDWANQDIIFDGESVIRRDYGRWRKVGLEWLPGAKKIKCEVIMPVAHISRISFSPPERFKTGHLHFHTGNTDLDIEFQWSKRDEFVLLKTAVESAM